MGRTKNKLTVNQVKNIKTKGRYSDGENLYLVVDANLNKHWKYIYRFGDKRPELGLGPYPAVSLADARVKSNEYQLILLSGGNPKEQKAADEALRLQRSFPKITTFKAVAEKFIATYTRTLKNPKHVKQWTSTITEYAYPILGELDIKLVDTSHILQILEPIWFDKNPTATRVRGRIEKILDAAKVEGLRSGENPARWVGHLALRLPHPNKIHEVKHFASLPYNDIPDLYYKLLGNESIPDFALRFAILTAVRTGNARLAKWDSVDFVEKSWTIPKIAMKMGDAAHKVPLSEQAIEILMKMKSIRHSDYIFPGIKKNKPINENALLNGLRKLGISKELATVHGFRSTLKVWGAETRDYPDELTEMVLAHVIKGQTKQAYFRTDLFEKRRVVMSEWADFVLGKG